MVLKIYKNYRTLSRAAARRILRLVREKPDCTLCFASGSTPRLTCEMLVEMAHREGVDFSKITFFGLDEWVGVPPENEGSCHFFFKKLLFEPLGLRPEQVWLFYAMSENLPAECAEMDSRIAAVGGIDLMLVGVGMNGHIGFNEPGVSPNLGAHVVDLDDITLTVGQKYFKEKTAIGRGVTLGFRHLFEARCAIIMANGAAKKAVVQRLLHDPVSMDFPATMIRNHRNGMVMIDEEAS